MFLVIVFGFIIFVMAIFVERLGGNLTQVIKLTGY